MWPPNGDPKRWICHRCFGLEPGDKSAIFCADDEFTNKVIFEKGFEVREIGRGCFVNGEISPQVGEKDVFFNVRTQKSTTKKQCV